MNEMLSQEEIDALLRGKFDSQTPEEALSPEEIDAIGEIGNISMGAAATALFELLNKRVTITTPDVSITTIRKLAEKYTTPFVAVDILYTEGLEGTNLLVMHIDDVKTITDLLVGGDGTQIEEELSDMHLSAIGEAMNQMMGSACTSLAEMFHRNISISPPNAFIIDFTTSGTYDLFDSDDPVVIVNFKLEISNLIESYIMQLLPIKFAKEMVRKLLYSVDDNAVNSTNGSPIVTKDNEDMNQKEKSNRGKVPKMHTTNRYYQSTVSGPNEHYSYSNAESTEKQVNVQPVSFQPLQEVDKGNEKENIDLILDVPLQITVELGKTKKLVQEILEMNSGSVIELDKMAGEPVDILVNGKMFAKGEVVVIDDSFGVRIIDIISPAKRISKLG